MKLCALGCLKVAEGTKAQEHRIPIGFHFGFEHLDP